MHCSSLFRSISWGMFCGATCRYSIFSADCTLNGAINTQRTAIYFIPFRSTDNKINCTCKINRGIIPPNLLEEKSINVECVLYTQKISRHCHLGKGEGGGLISGIHSCMVMSTVNVVIMEFPCYRSCRITNCLFKNLMCGARFRVLRHYGYFM